MPIVSLLFAPAETSKIGSLDAGDLVEIPLDAAIREVHSRRSTISRFPVERGSNVTDSIKNQPDGVIIEGIVTDSPLQFLAGIRAISQGGASPSIDAFDKLERLHDAELPITAVTGLKTYSSMGIASLDIPDDVSVGGAIRFSMQLEHVNIVSSETVELDQSRLSPDSRDKNQSEQATGRKQAQPPAPGPGSALADLFGAGLP